MVRVEKSFAPRYCIFNWKDYTLLGTKGSLVFLLSLPTSPFLVPYFLLWWEKVSPETGSWDPCLIDMWDPYVSETWVSWAHLIQDFSLWWKLVILLL